MKILVVVSFWIIWRMFGELICIRATQFGPDRFDHPWSRWASVFRRPDRGYLGFVEVLKRNNIELELNETNRKWLRIGPEGGCLLIGFPSRSAGERPAAPAFFKVHVSFKIRHKVLSSVSFKVVSVVVHHGLAPIWLRIMMMASIFLLIRYLNSSLFLNQKLARTYANITQHGSQTFAHNIRHFFLALGVEQVAIKPWQFILNIERGWRVSSIANENFSQPMLSVLS